MRRGMHFAILLLVVALFLVTAPAGGQTSVDRPTYSAGDFWAYDLALLTPIEFPDNTSAEFTLAGSSTVTIQGSETRPVGGEALAVYNSTHALRISATGNVSVPLFNETTFSAAVNVDETIYRRVEGLEVVERRSTFDINLTMTFDIAGTPVPIPFLLANGSTAFVQNYTADTWHFPLTGGQMGEESFTATGEGFILLRVLNLTAFPSLTYDETPLGAPLDFNATTSYEALLEEESVTVPRGTFTTLVVASKPTPGEVQGAANVSTLAYWSSSVGAPVRYTVTNETGEEQVEFALTGYRYQAAELSILGLPIAIAIPILVGVAAVAILLVIVLGRRRRPVMPPPPGPPGP